MTVYSAEFCDCIYEGGPVTLSLHTTKAGAYRAVRQNKMQQWERWHSHHDGWEHWKHQGWRVRAIEVQED